MDQHSSTTRHTARWTRSVSPWKEALVVGRAINKSDSNVNSAYGEGLRLQTEKNKTGGQIQKQQPPNMKPSPLKRTPICC